MTTMNTTKNSNTTITVNALPMSPAAYKEFYELRNAIEQNKHFDFESWSYNPYFLIAVYDYYKAINYGAMMNRVKSIIKSIDWFFDGASLYIYESDEQYKVTVRQYNGDTYHNKVYTGERGFEVIRDLCTPVVLNYK